MTVLKILCLSVLLCRELATFCSDRVSSLFTQSAGAFVKHFSGEDETDHTPTNGRFPILSKVYYAGELAINQYSQENMPPDVAEGIGMLGSFCALYPNPSLAFLRIRAEIPEGIDSSFKQAFFEKEAFKKRAQFLAKQKNKCYGQMNIKIPTTTNCLFS